MSLTEQEQLEVLQTFAKHKGNKVVMAGTARESTRETIELSKRVIDTGVDFVSILTPHYFAKRITDDVLIRYTEIADVLSVPVLIYNAPGFAGGVQISPAVVKQLAEHPNIVGMKDSSPSGMSGFLNVRRDNETFHILAGKEAPLEDHLLLLMIRIVKRSVNFLRLKECYEESFIISKDS